eukprot:2105829-Amphidinium_carterae.1
MTAQGIVRGTGLSRLAEAERWAAAGVADLKGLPWDWQGTELVTSRQDCPSSTASAAYSTSATFEANGRW